MPSLCAPGLSSLIGEIASGVVLLLFNLVLLRLSGNTGVAAYGVVANLALVGIAVFTGLCTGIQPLVSRSSGLGDREQLRRAVPLGHLHRARDCSRAVRVGFPRRRAADGGVQQ